MILAAILSIAALVVLAGIWFAIKDRDPGLAGFTFVVTAMFGGLVYVFAWVIIAGNPNTSHLDRTAPLVALASDSSAQGSFFLGSGVVDGKQTFAYLTDEGGYYTRGSVGANKSRIYIDDEPRLEVHQRCNNSRWLTPWDACMGSRSEYHFYIPEGSILEGFEVTP